MEPEPQPVIASVSVAEREPATIPAESHLTSATSEPLAIPTKPLTPAAHTRPGAAHRGSAKFKTDQAVVMPSSSFGSGIEKVGMQFGSLSLGGDDLDTAERYGLIVAGSSFTHTVTSTEGQAAEPASAPAPVPVSAPTRASEPVLASVPETVHAPIQQQQEASAAQVASPPAPIPAPASQTLFQQTLPQTQTQPQVVSPPQHSLPSSLSQSAIPTQQSALPSTTPASASMSQFSQHSQSLPQQSLSNHQLPQSQSQTQLHSQQHHQYAQHGLPTHLDPAQSQAQHSPSAPATQPQNINAAPSYFRQPEAPYFHTPTPPAGQSQESPYGAFGQLGQQHQGQGSHLGGFSGNEYGYNDNQRVCQSSHG